MVLWRRAIGIILSTSRETGPLSESLNCAAALSKLFIYSYIQMLWSRDFHRISIIFNSLDCASVLLYCQYTRCLQLAPASLSAPTNILNCESPRRQITQVQNKKRNSKGARPFIICWPYLFPRSFPVGYENRHPAIWTLP